MKYQLPQNLIFANSILQIVFVENAGLNKTKASIVIEGTREGFLSLSNVLLYLSNDLQEVIRLDLIPFVNGEVELKIECDDTVNSGSYGIIQRKSDNQFSWLLSESELCKVASELHSLGHLNNELHLDESKSIDDISIYCVVS